MSVELCGHCLARDLVCLGDCASNTPDQNPWQGANVFERLHRQGRALRETPASVPECQGGCAGGTSGQAPEGELVAKWCARREGVKTPT